jgi:hypothetical protein
MGFSKEEVMCVILECDSISDAVRKLNIINKLKDM